MNTFNRGNNSTNTNNYWRPSANGRNEVVLLTKPDDILWSTDFVKLFDSGKFGKAYPVNMTWMYTGEDDDPYKILCPEQKLGYSAIAWVAYQDDDVWKVGLWTFSKSVHNILRNLAQDSDVYQKVINVQKVGNNWNVTLVSKKAVPEEVLELEVPSEQVAASMAGQYQTTDAIWEALQKRMNVKSKQEVIDAFNGNTDQNEDMI